ncbi:hypothetical protein PoB_007612400 [Plakobranchus ocellatus]|uniref:Uncharacterized protein n=1 Tax=Plakobranchus ocellatus TaxID=259542 RepID=A0AAV4DZW4_9GAST|nr:hypothetical protein PoB_007612400 [Plakobranchus ocellatus]
MASTAKRSSGDESLWIPKKEEKKFFNPSIVATQRKPSASERNDAKGGHVNFESRLADASIVPGVPGKSGCQCTVVLRADDT